MGKHFLFLLSFIGLLLFKQTSVLAIANEPWVQSLSITSSAGACNEINISVVPGDGARRIVIVRAGAPVSVVPVDGTGYNGGSIYGTGTNMGNGNFVVFSGSGNATTINGFDGGAQYFFASFEFNGVGSNSNYLTSGSPIDSAIAPGISMTVLSSSGDICQGSSVQLQAAGAVTYEWSPTSTLSDSTGSIVTATPLSTTTYIVLGTDANGCQDTKSLNIIVNTPPAVSLSSFQSICINEGVVTLSGGAPVGGTYSGSGISNGQLNPVIAGPGTLAIDYTYTNIHGCTATASSTIQIKNAPVVTLGNFNAMCIDGSPIALSGGSPMGGTYSGTAVNGQGVFSPVNAGLGTHSIKYIVSAQGCSDTSVSSITVNPLPVVSFATLSPTCLNTTPFNLSGGTPVGGNYTGIGIVSNQFRPAVAGVGTVFLTYTYTNSNGCTASDTSALRVNGLPTVTFSTLNAVCANTGPVNLTQGSPAGGVYSGLGIGGNTFYTGIAGPGTHPLVYTYRDNNNCSNSATQNIIVNDIPAVNLGRDTLICSDASITLNGGNWSSYNWSNGATAPTIHLDTAGRGIGTFRFILLATNQFTCANRDTVFVTFDVCSKIVNQELSNLNAFPNPFSESIQLSYYDKYDVFVFDITGKLVFEKKDVSSLLTFGNELKVGVYLVKLVTSKGEYKKIVVKE